MPSVEQCRAYAAQYKILGADPGNLARRSSVLKGISRSWTALENRLRSCDHREIGRKVIRGSRSFYGAENAPPPRDQSYWSRHSFQHVRLYAEWLLVLLWSYRLGDIAGGAGNPSFVPQVTSRSPKFPGHLSSYFECRLLARLRHAYFIENVCSQG
jgi:hypothetical protein